MSESNRGSGRGAGAVDSGLRLRMRGEERRIESQHQSLDRFCGEVFVRIEKDGAAGAINDYLLFTAALDAHMTVEEDIYFPAFHGLRPDVGDELTALVAEHADLRVAMDDVKQALKRNDASAARLCLDVLARAISDHEKIEEKLIARITEGPV
jgi:hypothetical protein